MRVRIWTRRSLKKTRQGWLSPLGGPLGAESGVLESHIPYENKATTQLRTQGDALKCVPLRSFICFKYVLGLKELKTNKQKYAILAYSDPLRITLKNTEICVN